MKPKFKIKPLWLAPILFVALVLMLWGRLGLEPQVVTSKAVSKPLPEFELPNLYTGKLISSQDLPPGPFVLNVWATWCPSCKQEHSFLLALKDSGVTLVGVNFRDEASAAKAYLAAEKDPYVNTHLFDEEGAFATSLGLTGTPESFLVGADGLVYMHHMGMLSQELWSQNGFEQCYQSLTTGQAAGCM